MYFYFTYTLPFHSLEGKITIFPKDIFACPSFSFLCSHTAGYSSIEGLCNDEDELFLLRENNSEKVILPVARIGKRQRILLGFNLSARAQEKGVS